MDYSRVYEILTALADGVDPTTGEVFNPDSPYQQPEVIRALFHAARVVSEATAKADKRARQPARQGQAWETEEVEQLTAAFEEGRTLSEIAAAHQRSYGSIRTRLIMLGLLTQ